MNNVDILPIIRITKEVTALLIKPYKIFEYSNNILKLENILELGKLYVEIYTPNNSFLANALFYKLFKVIQDGNKIVSSTFLPYKNVIKILNPILTIQTELVN